MTQLNAINEIVDHLRSQGLFTIRPDSRRVKIERALKVLEARAEILRARAKRNRAQRSSQCVGLRKNHRFDERGRCINCGFELSVQYDLRVVREADGSLHWED